MLYGPDAAWHAEGALDAGRAWNWPFSRDLHMQLFLGVWHGLYPPRPYYPSMQRKTTQDGPLEPSTGILCHNMYTALLLTVAQWHSVARKKKEINDPRMHVVKKRLEAQSEMWSCSKRFAQLMCTKQ